MLKKVIVSQAGEIELLKKDQFGLVGTIRGERLSAKVKRGLIQAIESAPFSAFQACMVLGLNPDRFYQWRARESLVDKAPVAKTIPHRLLKRSMRR